jgi:uncharacterized protein YjbI with pentapeptide repeats
MADKLDPFDVGALERSVNDSAGRVSAIWLSFVAFSAYLAATASNVSHRQLFLEDTIKLPTINIDLPLVASAVLLPGIFVIYHIYVLLQVVLLARTADIYNEAVERSIEDAGDRARVRQRLANTLFAQLFAGSPREREGFLGFLLHVMAWVTLVLAPPLVLFVFEVKFLPYHSAPVMWSHRALIVLDVVVVIVLWACAIDPRRNVTWQSLAGDWKTTLGALWAGAAGPDRGLVWRSLTRNWKAVLAATFVFVLAVVLPTFFVTFPGEPTRALMRSVSSADLSDQDFPDCWAPKFIAAFIADSLSLPGEDFVVDDKLAKIIATAKANGQSPNDSERTRSFRGRDLRCGQFAAVDLRRADLSEADLSGASLKGALLEGARFSGARLAQAVLEGAQLQGASFAGVEDVTRPDDLPRPAILPGASFRGAQLQGASFKKAQLQGASFDQAQLHGADLDEAELQGASFNGARLHGTTLRAAVLHATLMVSTQARGASFAGAQLQAAALGSGDFRGADFEAALLQGTRFDNARLTLASFSNSFLWRSTGARCNDAQVTAPDFEALLYIERVRTPRQRGGESIRIKAEPEALDKFIERSSEPLPAGKAAQVRARLKERLSPQDSDKRAEESEMNWSECAKSAVELEGYQKRLVESLVSLICEPGADGKYVVEGLYRSRLGFTGTSRQAFARSLLGLDDRPCPGASDVDEKIKSELREAATF